MTMEEAFQQAQGYAWGRADAGQPTARAPGISGPGDAQFALAYASAQGARNCGIGDFMPSVQSAYHQWQKSGGLFVIEPDTEEAPDEPV